MPQFNDFTYTSSTGVNTIHARECLPDIQPKAIVQIVHGIAEYINRYDDFMLFLANNGYIAVGEDHLGHGASFEKLEDRGFFAESDGWNRVLDDMDKLRDLMHEKYPDLPYIFFGHSMGSFLTRNYIILHGDKYNAAVICGTGHMGKPLALAGYSLASAAVKLYGPRKIGTKLNSIAFGSYTKKIPDAKSSFDWINSDRAKVDAYTADPKCGFVATVSLFRDMMGGILFITNQKNIEKMSKKQPILFIAGKDDPVGDYGVGIDNAYKAFCKAGCEDVTVRMYDGMRHEILNEPEHSKVYSDVLTWLQKKLG